ncbi:hypothetical protein CC2G_002239 [Coprinopsis cinerea AmutBmut pab1-1]|nr:hypothetical protein CC2G_002239 [Coprinopsis cinerea AmutBmut pab1-1]
MDIYQDSHLYDIGPAHGPRLASSVVLAATHGTRPILPMYKKADRVLYKERQYPRTLQELATYIQEPQFTQAFLKHLHILRHPTRVVPDVIANSADFTGKIHVHHSAVARFYAPSDACGAGGMQRQIIRCNPQWRSQERRDTVFVAQGDEPGMQGMLVAQLRLLFSFTDPYTDQHHSCALVNWFNMVGDEPDSTEPGCGWWRGR